MWTSVDRVGVDIPNSVPREGSGGDSPRAAL